jgi:hypothetical protein
MAMNETVTRVLGFGGGRASARFSSAASGGRFARAFRPNGRRFGFFGSLLLRTSIAVLAGFYLSPAVIGSGCWRVCSDSSSRASS